MSSKPCIVVLSGGGAPAIAAANIYYRDLSFKYRIVLIEEKTLTFKKVLNILRRRLHNYGFFSVADFLSLRTLFLIKGYKSYKRQYKPAIICSNINDEDVVNLVKAEKPDWVITNACSILSKTFLAAIKAPILNVHNGIAPRYRGAGNFWAVRENNPSLIGVTVHYVDEGIDTGARVAMASMAIDDIRCLTLGDIDIAAFEDGAALVCRYILQGETSVPGRFFELSSCYYSYPGLTDWIVAKKNLKRWQDSQVVNSNRAWGESFAELAVNKSLDKFQRMHWGQSATVIERDDFVIKQAKKVINADVSILDVGGGDGRLASQLKPFARYINADYTLTFLREMNHDLNQGTFAVQCNAEALPFAQKTFGLIMAIGLLQHISDAQCVIDGLLVVKEKNGVIIVNTLRQFSFPELFLVFAGSIFSGNRRRLAYYILKKDYYSGRKVGGVLLARRYEKSELIRMFRWDASRVAVHYNGLFGTAFLSREITLVFG